MDEGLTDATDEPEEGLKISHSGRSAPALGGPVKHGWNGLAWGLKGGDLAGEPGGGEPCCDILTSQKDYYPVALLLV